MCTSVRRHSKRYPLGGVRCLGGWGRNYGGVTFSINWRPPLGEKQSRLETRRREREIETALLLARKAMLVLVTQGSAKFKFLGCESVAGSFWQR